MTAKEKANYLVDAFINRTRNRFEREALSYRRAKVCALIAVYEIISSHLLSDKIFDTHPVDYWNEVKQEIEKL